MPAQIKESSLRVFRDLGRLLKSLCLKIQDYDDACQEVGMSPPRFRETLTTCITELFEFFAERIDECPQFLHITEMAFSQVELDGFVKTDAHGECCLRTFAPTDWGEQAEKEYLAAKAKDAENQLCTCTPMDLCMQTNHLLDNAGREVVYNFFFKMFQSYRWK